MCKLEGKTAVITGASRGIGRATSLALADKGIKVVLVARNEEALLGVKDEITARGGKAFVMKTDLRSNLECKRLIQSVLDSCGQIDVLVNNAGVRVAGPIENTEPEAVTDMVKINFLGVYYCTLEVLGWMKKRNEGDIVNICSEVALRYIPERALYSATKVAIRSFSDSLRNEVQKYNIRVATIYPGRTDTQMVGEYSSMEKANFLKPDDVANAILWVLESPRHISIAEILVRPTVLEA